MRNSSMAICRIAIDSIILLILFTACSSSLDETAHSFRIYEEDGVTIAETTGGPKYEGDLFKYEQLLELQEDPENEESLLYRASDFVMDESGYFYVDDYGNHRIAVFDQIGQYSHSMGRQGGGPGEFRRTIEITEIHGDTVHVYENYQDRITRFRTDGTLIDVITVRNPTVFVNRVYHIGGDQFLGLARELTAPSRDPVLFRSQVFVHNSRGDTLWSRSTTWVEPFYRIPDSNSMNRILYGAVPSSAYRRGWGWIITTGDDPSLHVHNVDGTLRLRIMLDLPRMPVTREDYDRRRSLITQSIDRADSIGAQQGRNTSQIEAWKNELRQERSNLRAKEYKAFWTSAEIDDAFYLWLEVPESDLEREESGGGSMYRILSPEGEFLGLTRRPTGRSRVCYGHLLALEMDAELGAYKFVVYRIRSAVDGLKYP